MVPATCDSDPHHFRSLVSTLPMTSAQRAGRARPETNRWRGPSRATHPRRGRELAQDDGRRRLREGGARHSPRRHAPRPPPLLRSRRAATLGGARSRAAPRRTEWRLVESTVDGSSIFVFNTRTAESSASESVRRCSRRQAPRSSSASYGRACLRQSASRRRCRHFRSTRPSFWRRTRPRTTSRQSVR